MQLVRLLKDAGIGAGHGGNTEARRQRKVLFVKEIVSGGTGAPAPTVATREYTKSHVRVFVSVDGC